MDLAPTSASTKTSASTSTSSLTSTSASTSASAMISSFKPTTISSDDCEYPAYLGDGFCDYITNTVGCNWDGGDCCGSNLSRQNCLDCKCLDPNA